jgi:hypothetical protein
VGKGVGDVYLPRELLPAHLQWVSLIRAIRVAYSGLVGTKPTYFEVDRLMHLSLQTRQNSIWQSPHEEEQLPGDDGPTTRTRQLFLPITAATWDNALARLHETVRATIDAEPEESISESYDADASQQSADTVLSDIKVCITSLDLLHEIFSEVFSENPLSQPFAPKLEESYTYEDCASLNGLSKLEPWLRSYLARVTSNTPHKPLRRIIMAFIHRLPARYLDLVQKTLDLLLSPTPSGDRKSEYAHFVSSGSKLNKLFIDIFAHWLVLVMLLDGVWWIGDIGIWELKRVISAMRKFSQLDSIEIGDNWWPQSMYMIREKLNQL